ncbi:MAG: hypothetical protein IJA10_13350 [Lachnospiraceae bacterium]|nr:hypothetical protein [Lachnospiraceae bacterium]
MTYHRRKRGQKKGVGGIWIPIVLLAILLVLAVILFMVADKRYREQNKALYADEMEFYLSCMEQEKEWIATQQGEEGAIYLYDLGEDESGSVVPYFSCLAALGMLAGEPGEEELQFVENYLVWHTEELVKSDGIISDYRVTPEGLESKDSYDSVDSYIALYLNLLATYLEKGGSLEQIPYVEEAVEVCVLRLMELSWNGLTKVSEEKEVYYLMDNLEILEAYEKMAVLMNSENEEVENWENKDSLETFFKQAVKASREEIKEYFWNSEEERFEIGMDSDFSYLDFHGMEEFYPYAIAQVYPVACGTYLIDKEKIEELYLELSQEHSWQDLSMEEDFEWPVLSYIAVKLGDIESAEEYLENYRREYAEDREYPFNTSDAGWAVRTYAQLYDYYEEKANQGLLDLFVEKIK